MQRTKLYNVSFTVCKELARTATGRLNNGVPQVPPQRGNSDLVTFTKSLPINQYKNIILKTIHENQVCLVSGETGSGKTTQVSNEHCYVLTKFKGIIILSVGWTDGFWVSSFSYLLLPCRGQGSKAKLYGVHRI